MTVSTWPTNRLPFPWSGTKNLVVVQPPEAKSLQGISSPSGASHGETKRPRHAQATTRKNVGDWVPLAEPGHGRSDKMLWCDLYIHGLRKLGPFFGGAARTSICLLPCPALPHQE